MKTPEPNTTEDGPRYDITVKLVGTDSNAMMLMGKVRAALRRAHVSNEEIGRFSQEAMSGDYDNVLATCMKWVNVT